MIAVRHCWVQILDINPESAKDIMIYEFFQEAGGSLFTG
jgi:hypothetical protein